MGSSSGRQSLAVIQVARPPPLFALMLAVGGVILIGAGLMETPSRLATARNPWRATDPALDAAMATAEDARPLVRPSPRARPRVAEGERHVGIPWRSDDQEHVWPGSDFGWGVPTDLLAMAAAQRPPGAPHPQICRKSAGQVFPISAESGDPVGRGDPLELRYLRYLRDLRERCGYRAMMPVTSRRQGPSGPLTMH